MEPLDLPARGPVPLGIHAGVWGFGWAPAEARRAIAGAAAAGYDLIEIPASPQALADPATTRDLLAEHGLAGTVSLALDEATDISGDDAAVARAGEDRLVAAVELAHAIGAPFVGGVLHSAMTRYRRLPTPGDLARSAATIGRVARHAAGLGVTLGVEYVNRYESHLLTTAAQTLGYVEAIDEPNVVVHLDTFHAHVEERSVPDAIRIAAPRLGYIHASESHRGALGDGALDWEAIVAALVETGFRGAMTVETFSPAVVSARDAVDIALWRTLWSDPDAVARAAATTLRAAWEAHAAPASSPHTLKEQS